MTITLDLPEELATRMRESGMSAAECIEQALNFRTGLNRGEGGTSVEAVESMLQFTQSQKPSGLKPEQLVEMVREGRRY